MLVPGFDISMINFDFVLIFCRSSLTSLGLNFDLWLMVQFLEIKYKNQLFNNYLTILLHNKGIPPPCFMLTYCTALNMLPPRLH